MEKRALDLCYETCKREHDKAQRLTQERDKLKRQLDRIRKVRDALWESKEWKDWKDCIKNSDDDENSDDEDSDDEDSDNEDDDKDNSK